MDQKKPPPGQRKRKKGKQTKAQKTSKLREKERNPIKGQEGTELKMKYWTSEQRGGEGGLATGEVVRVVREKRRE